MNLRVKLSGKQLLVIGTVWPEPKSSAAGVHLLSLIQTLQAAGAVCHFACPANSYKAQHTIDLSELGITAHTIILNDSSFDTWVGELAPDIVLFDRFMMEEQFSWRVRQACPQALCVLDTEDVHSLRNLRQQITHKAPALPLSIKDLHDYHHGNNQCQFDLDLTGCLHNELALRELTSMMRMDLSLIISATEMDYLTRNYPIASQILHHCPFLVPPITSKTQASWLDYDARRDFVFIGNYRHAPNWDAVQVLAKTIWPQIRSQIPDAKCYIYGAYTPAKAQQFHQPKKGLYIAGWAQDAQDVLAKARVNLAPLRFGAGLKGKVFDAMQVGTPTVMTDIAAEGIFMSATDDRTSHPSTYDHHQAIVAVNDDFDNFAQAAIELYKSSEHWHQAQAHFAPHISAYFNRGKQQYALVERISDACNNLNQKRQTNFWQALVNQQQLKATQYMSQWIEAKQTIAQLHEIDRPPAIDSSDD